MDIKEGWALSQLLEKSISKRAVVNSYKINDWEKYKKLTNALIDARNAIYDSEEGK